MVTELNENNFDEFVEKNELVMIDCWAPWCRPCRMIAPIVEELAEELKGKVAIAKLNTDENQGIAMRFMIEAIPTMLIFKNGVQLPSLVGLRPKEALVDHLMGL